MTKTLNHIIFFFLHQNQNIFFSNIGNQNIFFSNIGNQNIFLEKNHKNNNINQYKDIGCAWDVFKNTVREKTINFCKSESQKRKSEIQVLEQKLKSLNVKKKEKKKRYLMWRSWKQCFKTKNLWNRKKLENLYFFKSRRLK